MTEKPSLKRSATLNFVGGILPMFVALVTTPIYLHHIGAGRYGVLAIVWIIVVLGGGEYHRKHVGQPGSWKLFGITIGAEVLVIAVALAFA